MTFKGWSALSRLGVAAILFSLPGHAGRAEDRNRIQGPIRDDKEGKTVVLHGSIHPVARMENDRGRLDPGTIIHGVKLILSPADDQSKDLEQLLEAQRDPFSPDFRSWLSPEEFAERFGASENDLASLRSWLESRGLAVEQLARARNWITFSGTAEQLQRVFHTELRQYEFRGEKHFANATEASIPAALAGIVTEIRGLNDFHPVPGRATLRPLPDFNASNGNHYLAPDDLAVIYDIQALYKAGYDGTAQKIAIAGQTDINIADIREFRSQFNLPAKDPQLVLAGADPGTIPNDQTEADLDLEWAGAVARNATLVYVYSPDVFDSLQYAIDQNLAPVISLSYGGCETYAPASFRSMAQQASAQGISWMNSSGDSGAAGCDYGEKIATNPPSATFPADIPEVTAVGGTEFNEAGGTYWSNSNSANIASALSWIPEKAWNDTSAANGLAAGGGGASKLFAKPWWQTGAGVPNDQARDVPDVSLAASGAHDAYVIYARGGLLSVGGTSAGAPAFAGMIAILNQYLVAKGTISKPGLGNLNPALYALALNAPAVFHDIAAGDNIVPCAAAVAGCVGGSYGYKAGAGYDLATGLGSVDAWNLVTKWINLPPAVGTTLALSAAAPTLPQNGTTQLVATVSPVSGKNIPAGTVAFSTGTTSLGSVPVTASGAAAQATLQLKGNLLALGSETITASYSGAAGFSGSTASTIVIVTAPAIATSISVTANPATIAPAASTILTATVKPASGNAAPTGTVTFSLAGAPMGAAILVSSGTSATATLTLKGAGLALGANAIIAGYAGAGGFGSASSAPLTVTVTIPPVATRVALTATPASILQSASTVLTAIVKPDSGNAPPTGTVTFSSGNTVLGISTLSIANASATAALTVRGANLVIGQNTIAAAYSGGSGFVSSSGTAAITITAPVPATTLTVAANPATLAPNAGTTLTATVTAAAGNIPPGSVTFSLPGGSLGSVPLSLSGNTGTAALALKAGSLAQGANNITAIYVPSGRTGGAASSVIVNVLAPPLSTIMTLTSSPAAIAQSGSTQLTATVWTSTGASPPIGSVTFVVGKTTIGSAILKASGTTATAKFTVKGSSLTPGSNVVNAIYVGPGFPVATASLAINVTAQPPASR